MMRPPSSRSAPVDYMLLTADGAGAPFSCCCPLALPLTCKLALARSSRRVLPLPRTQEPHALVSDFAKRLEQRQGPRAPFSTACGRLHRIRAEARAPPTPAPPAALRLDPPPAPPPARAADAFAAPACRPVPPGNRIAKDVYDSDAWRQLFEEASKKLKIGESRKYYQRSGLAVRHARVHKLARSVAWGFAALCGRAPPRRPIGRSCQVRPPADR